jgi:hypothetical protein
LVNPESADTSAMPLFPRFSDVRLVKRESTGTSADTSERPFHPKLQPCQVGQPL